MDDNLRSVWERLDRPEKAPKPGLTVGRIVGAAIELADADGLAAVSMARVAERLGFTTMSLYRHVRSKDELLVLILDAVGEPPASLTEPCDGWRAGIERWASAHLTLLRAHPWVLQVPMAGPPSTPNQLAWMDHGLRVLEETPLTPADRISVLLLVTGFVMSQARFTIDIPVEAERAYGGLLRRLVNGERFPALNRVVDAGVFDDPGFDPDYDFRFGLDRLLDGVEKLVEQRS